MRGSTILSRRFSLNPSASTSRGSSVCRALCMPVTSPGGCHHSFLGIAPDGDLYPCGMFQGEPAFRYGNIHSMSPESIATTALFGRIEDREARVLAGCSTCAFFDLCYGGCMFHSLKNGGLFEEKDYYCAGYSCTSSTSSGAFTPIYDACWIGSERESSRQIVADALKALRKHML